MGNNEDYFVKRPVEGNSVQNKPKAGTNPDRRIVGNESNRRRGEESTPPKQGIAPKRVRPEGEGEAARLPADTTKKKGLLTCLANGKSCAELPEGYKVGSVDMVFLVILAIIIALGTVMVFSSSHAYATTKTYFVAVLVFVN